MKPFLRFLDTLLWALFSSVVLLLGVSVLWIILSSLGIVR